MSILASSGIVAIIPGIATVGAVITATSPALVTNERENVLFELTNVITWWIIATCQVRAMSSTPNLCRVLPYHLSEVTNSTGIAWVAKVIARIVNFSIPGI